jgi:adenine-specific DNA-methyltransferase
MPQLTFDQIKESDNHSYISSNSKSFKKLFSEFKTIEELESIEAGLVKYFIYKNNISTIQNFFLNEIIKKDDDDTIFTLLKKEDIKIDIFELVRLFELLIPSEDRRINGAVYTPRFIVDYIVENTIDHEGTVCDCSCGSGIFLLYSLKRLHSLGKTDILTLIENYLYGTDILDYSIRRSKIVLTLYGIQNGADK